MPLKWLREPHTNWFPELFCCHPPTLTQLFSGFLPVPRNRPVILIPNPPSMHLLFPVPKKFPPQIYRTLVSSLHIPSPSFEFFIDMELTIRLDGLVSNPRVLRCFQCLSDHKHEHHPWHFYVGSANQIQILILAGKALYQLNCTPNPFVIPLSSFIFFFTVFIPIWNNLLF